MQRYVFALLFFCILFSSLFSTENIEEQIKFLSIEDQFDFLYNLSVQLYFTDFKKSLDYAELALEKAVECNDDNKLILAYYNIATAYSFCKDYEKAGSYLTLFNEILMQKPRLHNEFIGADSIIDAETKYQVIRNQLLEMLQKREHQELELANKQLLLQNQENIQKYYLIILVLVIIFAVTSYRQWHLVQKTNKKLEFTNQELNSANYKLEQIARTDPLTRISNRRDMIEKIDQEKRRFSRNGKPFVIVMSDIDDFKIVNDKYGHDAGDFVLQSVAHLMRSSMRKQDIIGRWGGEEFLMLLPETDLEGGQLLAEKLRKTIAETPFIFGKHEIKITMTLGVNVYNVPEEIRSCIKSSDEAMYKGKNAGKNCVVSAK
ncbi:MAG: GGDEF domain-containing protein [Candidatus Cloacimonetes bacterium]|nr:GGDEF domain-containing protein [Candidatus Cloacimonadota bacterium]MCF7814643.1 GGDEF domain-containing protein [Candidatus Cloacimonadota bacterium]MCF7869110.1 GGDEF domain-containing protein [Candidatus Cloacimonadota bacterium]MCF7884527.1 GGDEF domain-containing protein [Candidatus Cloacimonadota bacterium]